uniref:CDT1 Geminin-binding domain-containing protein n=1 Tax=Parascaris univalens TaxID=6257 RepID=A0A915C4D6_PARUN
METARVKRLRMIRQDKVPKFVNKNVRSKLKQPKVTEYFSTVHRASTSGAKRVKLESFNVPSYASSKSVDDDTITSEAAICVSNESETAEGSNALAGCNNEALADSSSGIQCAEEQLEDCTERSICSEKRDPELRTPPSVDGSPLQPISPRIRKMAGVRDASATRYKASRSLVFGAAANEASKDSKCDAISPTKVAVSKNLIAEAAELASIVKYNSQFRNTIKGSIEDVPEIHERFKAIVSSQRSEQQPNKVATTKENRHCTTDASISEADKLKINCPSPEGISDERLTTSSGAPEVVLPPLKSVIPCSPRTPSKHLQQKSHADDELRSPLKYGRAALLISEVKKCASLPLPTKYERLYRLFGHMERVVAILHSQDRRITLEEVTRNVQKNIKCEFTMRHFAQIMSVYPNAFIVRLEDHWAPIGGTRGHESRFDCVIEPNLKDDIIGYMREEEKKNTGNPPVSPISSSSAIMYRSPHKKSSVIKSPFRRTSVKISPYKKTPIKMMPSSSVDTVDIRPRMEAWRMTARAYIFKYQLQQFVKRQHKRFLDRIGVEIKTEELDNLQRYHPDFNLNDVEDIPEAKLPDPPQGDEGLPKTMREYMKKVEDSVDTLPQKIKEMINELRSPEKHAALASGAKTMLSSCDGSSDSQKPKGLSLLERIRAKEQAKKYAEMMRDPAVEIRKGRLERLSRSTLRNICSYYAFKKATTVELNEMISKLAFSDTGSTKLEIEAQIELLCDVAPEFFTMKSLREVRYLHLQRNEYGAIHSIIIREMAANS